MQILAFQVHNAYGKIFGIHCKAHHILHYPDLIRKFGPLYLYSSWRYERKHQYSKSVARIMGNFLNPPFTIHTRHQVKMAAREMKLNFAEIDFFPQVAEQFSLMEVGDPRLPVGKCEPLLACDRPMQMTAKSSIVKRLLLDKDLWFRPMYFFRVTSTGAILCQGEAYKPRYSISISGKQQEVEKVLSKCFIDFRGLHYSKAFLELAADNKYYLLHWMFAL